jgi:hypothetical protein
VGRASVEAVGEDLAALGEAVVGEDPAALGEAVVAEAWRRVWRSGSMCPGPGGGRRGTSGGPSGGRGGRQRGAGDGPDDSW